MPAGESLLDEIYNAVAEPSRWPKVLAAVADNLGAIGGMIAQVDLKKNESRTVIARLSVEKSRLFEQRHSRNPWAERMLALRPGKAMAMGPLLDWKALARTEFYGEILGPQGIEDAICWNSEPFFGRSRVGGFGFYFDARRAERFAELLPLMQALVPHLDRALAASLALGTAGDASRSLERTLELLPHAALLIDSGGRVSHANTAAETLFATHGALGLNRDGVLEFRGPSLTEAAALTRTLGAARAVSAGKMRSLGDPIRLTRPDGRPFLVVPVPLPPPAFALWNALNRAKLIVLIIDPYAERLQSARVLHLAFGLTAAEVRTAIAVASGQSGPQAARALGISPDTVKTHLRHCFEKTGVNSQVDLARIIALLPTRQPNGV